MQLSTPTSHRRPSRGIALVTTLFFLALLTILVVGYLASMRQDLRSSSAISNTQETKMIAQGALAHAIGLLRDNIPDPHRLDVPISDLEGRAWATNPGLLTVVTNNGSGDNKTDIPLHTGETTTGEDWESVDLNSPIPGTSSSIGGSFAPPAIAWPTDEDGNPVDLVADPNSRTGTNRPEMRVQWVNILQDASQPADKDSNPITGRYAFWIDDESTKVNYNTALGKPADVRTNVVRGIDTRVTRPLFLPIDSRGDTVDPAIDLSPYGLLDNALGEGWFGIGTPRSVNIDLFVEDLAAAPFNYNLTTDDYRSVGAEAFHHFFRQGAANAPDAITTFLPHGDLLAAGTVTGADITREDRVEWFRRNRFNLTHISRAPEFNPFARPRTMPADEDVALEGSGLYQMPFFVDGVSHFYGLMAGRHRSEAWWGMRELVVDNIYNYMAKDNWPGYDGVSFVDKYGPEEAYQIALNLWATMHSANYSLPATRGNRSHDNDRYVRPGEINGNALPGSTPEVYFWQNPYADDPNTVSGKTEHLPQTTGPYLSEIAVKIEPVALPKDNPSDTMTRYALKIWWEGELYSEPFGSVYSGQGTGGASERGSRSYLRTDYLSAHVSNLNAAATEPVGFTGWEGGRNQDRWIINGAANDDVTTRGGWHEGAVGHLNHSIGNGVGFGPTEIAARHKNFKVFSVPSAATNRFYLTKDENRRTINTAAPNLLYLLTVEDTDIAKLDIDVELRVGIAMGGPGAWNNYRTPIQVVPRPLKEEDDPDSVLEFNFKDIELDGTNGPTTISYEVRDPFKGHHKESWTLSPDPDQTLGEPSTTWPRSDLNNLGSPIEEYLSAEFAKQKTLAERSGKFDPSEWTPRVQPPGWPAPVDNSANDNDDTLKALPSTGLLSLVRNDLTVPPNPYVPTTPPDPADPDSGDPRPTAASDERNWGTLSLSNAPNYGKEHLLTGGGSDINLPPDFLLLDLFAAGFPIQINQWLQSNSGPDTFSALTYSHSIMGKVNINSRVYPENPYFGAPSRKRPLRAAFRHFRSDGDIQALVDDIDKGAHNPTTGSPNDEPFLYTGQLKDLPNYPGIRNGDSSLPTDDWEREELLRNFNSLLTTNSNVFGVWGAAQKVRKSQANLASDPGAFEEGDGILGEKRFYAVVERYLWTGRDGKIGNASIDASTGEYDKLATNTVAQTTEFLPAFPGSPPRIPITRFVDNPNLEAKWAVVDGPSAAYIPGQTADGQPAAPEYLPGENDHTKLVTGLDRELNLSWCIGGITYDKSSLESADNPVDQVFKYRVLYFEYLDE